MAPPSRRRVLKASSALALGTFAGCLGRSDRTDTKSPECRDELPDDTDSLTDWERSTDCDDLYEGLITVERVTTSLGDEYAPIRFAELSSEEKEVLRAVTEDGGYATCDTSRAFDLFEDRVSEHAYNEQDPDCVYLERECIYYGLYVQKLDEMISAYCGVYQAEDEDPPEEEDEEPSENLMDIPFGLGDVNVGEDVLPDDEYVSFSNASGLEIDFTGLTLRDRSEEGDVETRADVRPFRFPNGFTLRPDGIVRIVTGGDPDENTDEVLHWGAEMQIWDPEGDTVIIRDGEGETVFRESYSDQTTAIGSSHRLDFGRSGRSAAIQFGLDY